MAYPHPTADTLADGTIHVLGLGFAIPATILLTTDVAGQGGALTPTLVYAACFVMSLLASAIYHLVPFDRPRALLGRIDHAAIYFKIAGTYTPLVMLIGTGFAYGILAVVWALAIIGAIAKLSFWSTESKASLYLYLGMGWLSVLLVWPMWQSLPPMALTLIGAGGLIYSLGTVIFAHPGMRFQNAIWHSFVLTASICFFAAISISL
ncbi:MAG: hemolysin III family protein [Sulfitobacter sp.]|jgi:hemolysin III|uniref:PAQR family membrane homeostasis protein TrhA n=1 Tax=unclassified Sulfitobacter TaxID=196795 RepID=UPI00111050F8|nr:hemolysin III family protein [Sulfitobacter sp. BSw21498]